MRPRNEQSAYVLGLRYLGENPEGLTALELTEMLGITKRNVLMYIRMWRDEKKVRICDWRRANKSGDMVPVYSLLSSPGQRDKAKPNPMTEAEKQARYREKMGPIIRARRRFQRTGDFKHFKLLLEGVTK